MLKPSTSSSVSPFDSFLLSEFPPIGVVGGSRHEAFPEKTKVNRLTAPALATPMKKYGNETSRTYQFIMIPQ